MPTQSQTLDSKSSQDKSTTLGPNDISIGYSRSERVQQLIQVYADTRMHRGADTNQRVSS